MADRLLDGRRTPRRKRHDCLEAFVNPLEGDESDPVGEAPTACVQASDDSLDDEDEWEYEEDRRLVIRVLGITLLDASLGTTRTGERG